LKDPLHAIVRSIKTVIVFDILCHQQFVQLNNYINSCYINSCLISIFMDQWRTKFWLYDHSVKFGNILEMDAKYLQHLHDAIYWPIILSNTRETYKETTRNAMTNFSQHYAINSVTSYSRSSTHDSPYRKVYCSLYTTIRAISMATRLYRTKHNI